MPRPYSSGTATMATGRPEPAWGEIATQQRRQRVLPGKTRAQHGGEPYRGRIHMWDHQGGITTHGHLAQHKG